MTPDDVNQLVNAMSVVLQISWYEGAIMSIGIYTLVCWVWYAGTRIYRVYRIHKTPHWCPQCNCIDCLAESCRLFER